MQTMNTGVDNSDLVWITGWEITMKISNQLHTPKQSLKFTHTSTGSQASDVSIDNVVVLGATCGTGAACVCRGTEYTERGDTTDDAVGVVNLVEASGQLSEYVTGMDAKYEMTCARCIKSDTVGAVYSHWGNATCPSDASTLYTGYMAGSLSTTPNSGSSYMCMTSKLGLDQFSLQQQAPNPFATNVYVVEYHYSDGPLSMVSAL
eukprot:SAG11_NODE_1474_length_4839_cov_2.761603_5_plen_204_part_01